ncbi:C40 family peptidase [Sphingobacterium sp. N143]|mgnify:CR=1 FL=1|uniref:C40 family peptidase n=1 Tax=Sphingobacterium sp. N143 TaxID=2746727 RepID=UPI002577A368|nr:C40 family peptidase [Sphingobacterium sp. N143]MDM1293137.1 C40 family peptidase [Sphingobacterium sp. N143]
MKYGICTLALVPLRLEQAHRSEMVSQVLFGELFEILNEQPEWTYIRMLDTSYMGWIQNGQFTQLHQETMDGYLKGKPHLVGREGGLLYNASKQFSLCHGTKLYLTKRDKCSVAGMELDYQGSVNPFSRGMFQSEVVNLARSYQDAPYLWGGRSQWGIDCSGFSQLIYGCFDISLPRDAYQQAEIGMTVDFISEIKAGDLAFFDNADGRITHVGIMLDSDTIIHASAKVRVDRMDSEGIFNGELNRYSHKLRIIKRYHETGP